MSADQKAELQESPERAESLTIVLGQSEHVKELVKESAKELSSANVAIKRELAAQEPLPGVENALSKSEAVEDKVLEASEKLEDVNRALQVEVRERKMVDHQLAAAIEQKDAARHAAFHDPLTGLPNRALFNDRLEHGLAQARRHGWTLAVMFIDLDQFKAINDTHGHETGDRVLQTIAGRLKENTRGDDTVCRHGGDEFLSLLMETRDEQTIGLIAQKIAKTIQAPFDVRVGDLVVNVSVGASIGIAIFPKHGNTADTLINSADKAMYRAKQDKSGIAFAG